MGTKKLGILFIFSVLIAFFAGYFIEQVLPVTPTNHGTESIQSITQIFKNYYYYDITDAQTQDAFVASMEATIKAYGEANNDPYTRLAANSLSTAPNGDESFIGIGVSFVMDGLNLRVTYVYPQGAAVGKLYPNDLVTGIVVNSEPLYFNTLSSETEVMSYLAGTLDETKTFIVEDPDQNETQIDITYKEILTPTAYTLDMPYTDLAYVKITRFSGYVPDVTPGTSQVFSEVLNTLESNILMTDSSNKTLIIDLRDNPGGALTALHNSNQSGLIPGIVQQLFAYNVEKPVFEMIPRVGDTRTFYGSLSQPKPYQIVGLVNGHSASAAEVLAAALSAYGGYPLYGTNTYGKGVYQNTINLLDLNNIRYSLIYTEGEWFYGDNQNVMTDPLSVNQIEQTGVKALEMPVYGGEVAFNEVSSYLGSFQAFLNYYYDLSGASALRTDGYFDQATQTMIETFQTEQGLTVSGLLDRETANAINDIYMARVNDITYDNQLQDLISLLES